MMAGLRIFADGFDGTLTTETMLVEDVNHAVEQVEGVAGIIEAEFAGNLFYVRGFRK